MTIQEPHGGVLRPDMIRSASHVVIGAGVVEEPGDGVQ
jgi:hypothetical protein